MLKSFKLFFIGLISTFIVVLCPAVYAGKGGSAGGQHPGKSSMMKGVGHSGKGNKNFGFQKRNKKNYGYGSTIKFSNKDKQTITNFYSAHPFRGNGLPPGIAKNLARGKPLPPGIAKTFLPKNLINSLGANPNYDYLVAGRDVLLVDKSNQIIADILYNIVH